MNPAKVINMKYSAIARPWFGPFFENAFVKRLKRLIDMRMVRFRRSTKDVLRWSGLGTPLMVFISQPMQVPDCTASLCYRRSQRDTDQVD
jgi:hypothetical protein